MAKKPLKIIAECEPAVYAIEGLEIYSNLNRVFVFEYLPKMSRLTEVDKNMDRVYNVIAKRNAGQAEYRSPEGLRFKEMLREGLIDMLTERKMNNGEIPSAVLNTLSGSNFS